MKACDDCPGAGQCSGENLYPVLVRVFDLYAAGTGNKFDILFALDDSDEEVLERYTANVSHACWTKAALLAIVEVIGRLAHGGVDGDTVPADVRRTIETARDAFERFPWRLAELVDQAPLLYDLIQERCPDEALCDALTKRAFVKMCKAVAYA